MRRFAVATALLLVSSTLALAQEFSEGELHVFYQRVQNFDFNSGDPSFSFSGKGFNGGGFGFVYNLNAWAGIFTQMSFLGGVEQGGLKMRMINEAQGLKLTKREVGPLNLYAKGGIGFVRHVFSVQGSETADYGTSFVFGGGTEVKIKEGMALVLDVSNCAISLPQLTYYSDRDKWDSSLMFTTGIAFQF
jgi:hypothetical protein